MIHDSYVTQTKSCPMIESCHVRIMPTNVMLHKQNHAIIESYTCIIYTNHDTRFLCYTNKIMSHDRIMSHVPIMPTTVTLHE